jgi:hypothetical protein
MSAFVAVITWVIAITPFSSTAEKRTFADRAGNNLPIRVLGIVRSFAKLKLRNITFSDCYYAILFTERQLATVGGVKGIEGD